MKANKKGKESQEDSSQPNEFKVIKGCELYPKSKDTRKPMIKRSGLVIDAEYSVECAHALKHDNGVPKRRRLQEKRNRF